MTYLIDQLTFQGMCLMIVRSLHFLEWTDVQMKLSTHCFCQDIVDVGHPQASRKNSSIVRPTFHYYIR